MKIHARNQPIRVCYAGTFERDYPRNRLVIRALRDAGAWVEVSHVPVFERRRDKSRLGMVALGTLIVRLILAYLYLLPDVTLRLLRCRILALGYIGQLDVILLAPIARLMGRRVLFNPLVTLTDTLVEDREMLRSASLAARLIWAIDWLALHLSHQILVDTEANGRYLQEQFGVPRAKLLVMPVGADEDVFHPLPSDDATPSGNPRVLFYGKFIPLHGIETVVGAAGIIQSIDDRICFELIGSGQQYRMARDLARNLELTNVTWVEWVSFEELGERLRCADIALGIFGASAKAGRVVPNKVHQSLATGVATITRESDAARAVLRHGEDALLVPAADPRALAHAILSLRNDKLRSRLARAGRASWSRQASREALAGGAQEVLRRLTHVS